MIKYDLHTHTNFCDGKNTPREMVEAAERIGLDVYGISGHSFTKFDQSYCMSREGTIEYRREMSALKDEYAGRMKVLCGVEQDYFSEESTDGYDYVIGSVHFWKIGGEYYPIDFSPEKFVEIINGKFSGDFYAAAELYFETVADVVRKTGADIIGHFDLITKFNEGGALFDESHPRYVAAWRAAADRLISIGRVFEINTGAISRGYRTSAYPSRDIYDYLKSRGAKFILSSDSHRADTLCFKFDEYETYADEKEVSKFFETLKV